MSLLPRHVDVPRRSAALPRDGMRVVAAFAALLGAALLITAGLLWRENARPRPQAAATHVSTRR